MYWSGHCQSDTDRIRPPERLFERFPHQIADNFWIGLAAALLDDLADKEPDDIGAPITELGHGVGVLLQSRGDERADGRLISRLRQPFGVDDRLRPATGGPHA